MDEYLLERFSVSTYLAKLDLIHLRVNHRIAMGFPAIRWIRSIWVLPDTLSAPWVCTSGLTSSACIRAHWRRDESVADTCCVAWYEVPWSHNTVASDYSISVSQIRHSITFHTLQTHRWLQIPTHSARIHCRIVRRLSRQILIPPPRMLSGWDFDEPTKQLLQSTAQ